MQVYQSFILLWIPLLPLLGFLINGSLAVKKARGQGAFATPVVSFFACLMPILSFAVCVYAFLVLRGLPAAGYFPFIQTGPLGIWMTTHNFSLEFGLHLDALSSLMALIVTGVGSLIHIYSTGYMHDDAGYAKYMSYLNLFLFFMLTLILADSLPLLFVGWEGVGLCSYLLIGFWFTDRDKAAAGRKAFVVNRIGDFAFLIGMFAIAAQFSSVSAIDEAQPFLNFQYILTNKNMLVPVVSLVAFCLFIGATGKSAQIPLYVWLPDAMAGPTPVSALIHAATMVTAGIYLIARLSGLFLLAPEILHLVAICGTATAVLAALIAITQHDIKKVLAYSTVSQLGYMFLALGVGGFSAAIFHVMTHAFFKACLFLGAGSVIHALHHEQDLRRMGGLFKKMPWTGLTFLISTLAIAGFPGLAGFFSKDEILFLTYTHGAKVLWGLALFNAGLTAFYMMRLFVCVFLGKTRYAHPEKIHESPRVMAVPLLILATLAVVAGYLGLPHLFGHSWIGDWLGFLDPEIAHATAESGFSEGQLMLMSTGWGLLCLTLAYVLYVRSPGWTQGLKIRFRALYELMLAKFKIDEIYHAVIVSPIQKFSDVILFRAADVKIIDGLVVNGFADASRFWAGTLARLQNGFLSSYLFYLLLGLVGVAVFLTW